MVGVGGRKKHGQGVGRGAAKLGGLMGPVDGSWVGAASAATIYAILRIPVRQY